MKQRLNASMLRDPGHCLALGFGSGLAPKAPGTFGTIAAIPIYFLLAQFEPAHYAVATAMLFVIGIPLCARTANAAGVHDHPAIVWDEIVGFLITMAWVPATLINVILGFLAFRVFDIWKPWPIRLLDQRIHGGLGIMLDDLVAALFAAIVLAFINYLSYI